MHLWTRFLSFIGRWENKDTEGLNALLKSPKEADCSAGNQTIRTQIQQHLVVYIIIICMTSQVFLSSLRPQPLSNSGVFYHYSSSSSKSFHYVLCADNTLPVTRAWVVLLIPGSHILLKSCRQFFTGCLRHRFPILPSHIKWLSKVSLSINSCNLFLLVLTDSISHNQYPSRKYCSRDHFWKPFALSLSSLHWFPLVLFYKHKLLPSFFKSLTACSCIIQHKNIKSCHWWAPVKMAV